MGKITINTDSLRDRKEILRHKVNDGDNVFRILPPFGEKANGYPYRKWTVAWLQDPENGRRRPYASPFSFGEDACPVFEYCKVIEQRRADEEAKTITHFKEKGLTDEQVKEKVKEKTAVYKDVLWNLKPKSTFFYNAVSKSGQLGILELKKTAHDFLKKIMSEYIKDYNQDPTSLLSEPDDSGVWIVVNRSGKDSSTEYKVEKKQSKVRDPKTNKISWEDDQEPLSENIVENYDTLAYDLSSLYKQVSYDNLKEILIANLAGLYDDHPELIVPGFEVEEDKEDDVPEVVTKPLGKKAVAIKLDSDDEDEPVVKAKPKAKPVEEEEDLPPPRAKAKPKAAEDDPLAYAEALLNN